MTKSNDAAGYIIYSGDTPLTVCITDKKRADLAYNVPAIMGENDITYEIDGKENHIGPDIRIVDKDGNAVESELDEEWFGYPDDNARVKEAVLDKIIKNGAREGVGLDRESETELMGQYTICTYDEEGCRVQFAPMVWDFNKASEMQNLMTYGLNPFVTFSMEGVEIKGDVSIINEDENVYEDQLNENWTREAADNGQDFADAVASIPADGKGLENI